MAVNIKAKFTKDTRSLNGLDAIAKQLVDSPLEEVWIVAKARVVRIVEDIEDGGTLTPTVNFGHIEVMASSKEEAAARKLFEAACKARLGDLPQQTLPGLGGKDAEDQGDDAEGLGVDGQEG